MPITGRPKKHALVITDSERTALEHLIKRARVNRGLAFRARLVLACAAGSPDTTVARHYRTTNATVGKWRTRFSTRRLEGLYDEPRVGAPRTISDAAVEAVIVQTLDTSGRDALEYAHDGREGGHQSHAGRPHLANVRAETACHPLV
jgi:hypothetical protein